MSEDDVSITKSTVSWPCEGIGGMQSRVAEVLFGQTPDDGGTFFQYAPSDTRYTAKTLSGHVTISTLDLP